MKSKVNGGVYIYIYILLRRNIILMSRIEK